MATFWKGRYSRRKLVAGSGAALPMLALSGGMPALMPSALAGTTGLQGVGTQFVLFHQTNLASDLSNAAKPPDPRLVNAWGIALSSMSPFWISDNGTGLSSLYNGEGKPFPVGSPLTVKIPPPSKTPDATAAPTGVVFNGTGQFVVAKGNVSGSSTFIFATEDGTISGWNRTVDPNNAILKVDNPTPGSGPVYKLSLIHI